MGEVRRSDRLFLYALKAVALFIILVFLSILVFLYESSDESFKKFGLNFFLGEVWSPNKSQFGALPFIYGTLMSSFLALLLATPISIGSALFITEIGPVFLRNPVRILIEFLAAVPSVVYGLWAIFVLAPIVKDFIQPSLKSLFPTIELFQGPSFGLGLFTAGLVLTIMIIPTITSICVEVFRSIPLIYREGAKALGATTWETIQLAVLKPGFGGIFSAVVLGLGRAMGETLAVAMVIGNRADISAFLFAPAATMSSIIANEYAEANVGLHLSSLSAIGLTLLLVSMAVNGLARWIIWKVLSRSGGRTL